METRCDATICCKPNLEDPVTILPGETVLYRIDWRVDTLGHFELPILIFMDNNGLREEAHTFRGFAMPQERVSHE